MKEYITIALINSSGFGTYNLNIRIDTISSFGKYHDDVINLTDKDEAFYMCKSVLNISHYKTECYSLQSVDEIKELINRSKMNWFMRLFN